VISRRTVSGKCSAVIGSCVVVNPEGWIVTAGHVLKECDNLVKAVAQTQALRAQIAAIEQDTTIDGDERCARLATVKSPKPDDADRSSVWFGKDRVRIKEGYALDAADLAIARLEPFDPSWVPGYPVFKDPTEDLEPGTSLCRLGFPFHRLEPTWDAATSTFRLPPETVPLPIFPIDGIFTRTAEIVLAPGADEPAVAPPYPLRMVETSSPGLPGQSGGPIFDANGRVWGIQVATVSYPLELNTKEPQYLNVGLGISPITIFGFFDDRGVKYQVSPP
jgi:hypothetical protein